MSKQQLSTRGPGMSWEFGITRKSIGVLAVSLLALTGVIGISQEVKANGAPEVCVNGVGDLTVVNDEVVISTTKDLVRWSELFADTVNSKVVIRQSGAGPVQPVELVLDCIFPAIEEFSNILEGNNSTIVLNQGVTMDLDRNVGLFSGLLFAEVSDLILEGEMTLSVRGLDSVGSLAGSAIDTDFENIKSSVSMTVIRSGFISPESGVGGLVGYLNMPFTTMFTSNEYHGTIYSNNEYVGGLIGTAEGSGILNISDSVVTGSIRGTDGTGGLIGYVGGTAGPQGTYLLDTAEVTANVTGKDDVGGLIGEVKNVLLLSVTEAVFSGSVSGVQTIGGLIGFVKGSNGTVTLSRASGTVSGAQSPGGLIGQIDNFLNISSSSFSGDVLATGAGNGGGSYPAGIVGLCMNTCSISNSSSFGTVVALDSGETGKGNGAGGIVGYLAFGSEISDSFSASDVTGTEQSGGIVGYNAGLILRSFSIGDVYGTSKATDDFNSQTGGLVGYALSGSQVFETYSAGAIKVTHDGINTGTFIGWADKPAQISNSVARSDADHSMTTVRLIGILNGTGEPNTETLESRTTAEMRNQATFEALDWDFEDVWVMSDINDLTFKGFPILQWQNLGSGEQDEIGGGFGATPQATITSTGNSLNVNLNKTRILRLSGSNLNLVTEARVGGKKAIINFARSNAGTLVISKLPLLPSGKYTLTLFTATGLVAGEVEIVKKAKIRKLRSVEATGNLKKQIRDVLQKTNRTYALAGTLRCWGVTTGTSVRELTLARQRAEVACAYAKSLKPELEVIALSRTGNGKPARNQVVKIRYLK